MQIMNSPTPVSQKKRYFYIIFYITFGGTVLYISGTYGVLSFIFSLSVYSLITYFFYNLWKTLRKKPSYDFKNYGEYFLYKVSIAIILCTIIIGGFSYYQNKISPTPMPTYQLSNGEKTVVFQAMSHIGSEKFYTTIQQNLTAKKQDGYVYFYEGVKPGTQQNMEKFDTAIGIKFDKDLYQNFSKLYGVVHQDNSIYYNLVNDKDFNVDLSIDQIMDYYGELNIKTGEESNNQNALNNPEVVDINNEIIKALASLNNRELSILRYINKGILNFIIGSEGTQDFVMSNFANQKLFDIILDKRNDALSKEILSTKHKKIFITYGLLHFKGVFDNLKKNDPNWKIIKTDFLYPIE